MPNHLKQADDSGLGQAHESECSEDVKATDEEVQQQKSLINFVSEDICKNAFLLLTSHFCNRCAMHMKKLVIIQTSKKR